MVFKGSGGIIILVTLLFHLSRPEALGGPKFKAIVRLGLI